MYKLLALFALAACVYTAQAGCVGCPFVDNSNSDEVLPELKDALKIAGLDVEVKSINKVTKQVTGGLKYEVEFTSESGKECTAIWLSAPWESDKPIDVSASCQ